MFSISANKRSWKAYFITLAIENDKANTACSNYMKVSEIGKDKIETINRMTNDKGDSLLLYFSNISKTIRVIHSPSSLGNNNLNPETLVVALDGFVLGRTDHVKFAFQARSSEDSTKIAWSPPMVFPFTIFPIKFQFSGGRL